MSHEADFMTAGYPDIPANMSQWETFWWPGGISEEYFDVGIWPNKTGARLEIIGREVWSHPDGRFILLLHIRNLERYPVGFNANHIRIPNR
jgi:hypothetical protein